MKSVFITGFCQRENGGVSRLKILAGVNVVSTGADKTCIFDVPFFFSRRALFARVEINRCNSYSI
jgi:hypothetical protein